jgi:hypothetical protein
MKNIDFKKVIGWLGVILRCQICQFKYNMKHIQIIETTYDEYTNNARVLIHADCEKCKSSVVFNIDISGPDILSVGIITDLTSKDSMKFSKYNPIDTNDVINIHKTIRQFNGDLIKALKES